MAVLKYLSLWNFRNYFSSTLELSPKINIFVGKNGHGKTNCLEALSLLISGRSFRTSFLKEMIRHESSGFMVQACFEKMGVEQNLRLTYSPQQKELIYNDNKSPSFSSLIGLLQGVFFSGFQNQLVKGAPTLRRRFLDLQCAQVDPLYLHHFRRYQKALKERNILLKEKKTRFLDLYEEILSLSAPYLMEQRLKMLNELESLSHSAHRTITGGDEQFKFEYESYPLFKTQSSFSSEQFLKMLVKERSKDLRFGHTSVGPHKDDLLFLLKGQDAKKFASEGQIQSLVIALHLAEYKRLLSKTGESPFFCVDDIGQNLDQFRLNKLYEILDRLGQVFITVPHLPNYSFKSEVKVFEIDNGTVKPLTP